MTQPVRARTEEYLTNNEVGGWYRASGLVLNDHWEEMRTAGLSSLLLHAVASGARVITADVAGLDAVFGDDAGRRAVHAVRRAG